MAKKLVIAKAPSADALAFANKMLVIARSDASAARALHEQKHFPQAVFSLQQAVEKTAKAVGLAMGVASPKELQKDWSHNPLKLSELLAEYREQQNVAPPPGAAHHGMSLERLKDFIKELKDPAALEEPFLRTMLDWSRSLIAEDRAYRNDPAKVRAERDSMRTWAIGDKTEANQIAKATAYADHITTALWEMVVIQQGLMVLGMATIPHAVLSRYPDATITPTELYTETYPLVVHLLALCDVIEAVMVNVQNFIDNATKLASIAAMPD